MLKRQYPLVKVNLKKYSSDNFSDLGAFFIQFLDDVCTYPVAPTHARHIIKLVNEHFYDNIFIHRVIKHTLVQMGCPMTRDQPNISYYGSGNCGKFLRLESTDEPNVRGIVGMARGESPNSASSQFYICLTNISKLNGLYTTFGRVVKGLEILDSISEISPWETKESYKQVYGFPNSPKSPIPSGLKNQIPSIPIAMFPELVYGDDRDAIIDDYIRNHKSEELRKHELLKNTFNKR
ncbi:MAG: peptidylprolyl isomerase [Nitrososphaerota archaeon]